MDPNPFLLVINTLIGVPLVLAGCGAFCEGVHRRKRWLLAAAGILMVASGCQALLPPLQYYGPQIAQLFRN